MEFHRGLVRAYDATTHTAAVLLVGSLSRVLLGIPVAHHIGPQLMTVGAACGVAFFAEGSQGVVLCTFSGAPAPWVTSSLIVDATVTPADLDFTPPTPARALLSDAPTQTITTTPTTLGTLSQAVTVPAGKTLNVLAIASAEMGCSAWTALNIDLLEVYAAAAGLGQKQGTRTTAASDRSTVTVAVTDQITATTTYTAKVSKALSANTEVAYRGNLAVLWWEATV